MDIENILNQGIRSVAGTAKRFYLGQPSGKAAHSRFINNRRGQTFMLRMASALHKSAKLRANHRQAGVHIPPFLIASIASGCNLRCAGCYARANGGCSGEAAGGEMTLADWERIFLEASGLGISFILLAGGEPLMRRDVITAAAQYKNIFFPVFTNGTLIDEPYIALFDAHRQLIPVLSIEGGDSLTDERRGSGVAETVRHKALALREKGILYGVSITVTHENIGDVTARHFIDGLREQGCGLAFFIEYVPAADNTEHLTLNAQEAEALQTGIESLRGHKQNKGMILLSFPGDEEKMGGCLAAGRGFFHINAYGGAEPCPFSPYAEMSMKEHTILEALQSPFFEKVRAVSAAEALGHKGGCTLFQHADKVGDALRAAGSLAVS